MVGCVKYVAPLSSEGSLYPVRSTLVGEQRTGVGGSLWGVVRPREPHNAVPGMCDFRSQ